MHCILLISEDNYRFYQIIADFVQSLLHSGSSRPDLPWTPE